MVNNTGVQPLLDMICMEQMRRAWAGFEPRASSSSTTWSARRTPRLSRCHRPMLPSLPALLPLLVIFFHIRHRAGRCMVCCVVAAAPVGARVLCARCKA